MARRKRQIGARAVRRQVRRRKGRLRDLLIGPKTRVKYNNALKRFRRWLSLSNRVEPADACLLDLIVSDFVEQLWDEGDPKSWGSELLSALAFENPALKRHLERSWQLIKAWGRHEVPRRAWPVLVEAVLAMAGLALADGQAGFAAGIVVGFHCLLRLQEILTIVYSDFTWAVAGTTGHLLLPETKSGSRSGRQESVVVSDQIVYKLVKRAQRRSKDSRLVDITPVIFRQLFGHYIRKIGLDPERLHAALPAQRRGHP